MLSAVLDCDADLSAENWSQVAVNGNATVVKFKPVADGYRAIVYDGLELWHETLDGVHIAKRNRELNPIVEATSADLLGHVQTTLLGKDSNVTSAKSGTQSLCLRCKARIDGMPFSWHFLMSRTESRSHTHHLTLPLIAMNVELSRRIDELYQLLKLKDGVINHLKGDGTQLATLPRSLKGGETTFDAQSFWKDMDSSKGFCDVSKCLMPNYDTKCRQLYSQVMAKMADFSGHTRLHEEAAVVKKPIVQLGSIQKDTSDNDIGIELQRRAELESRRAEDLKRMKEASKKKKLNL